MRKNSNGMVIESKEYPPIARGHGRVDKGADQEEKEEDLIENEDGELKEKLRQEDENENENEKK